MSVGAAVAQGVLNTQPGVGFESQSVSLDFGTLEAPLLQFSFGFATDEAVQPGVIPDSFTVTLQQANGATFILLTVDVTGVAWAPPTPGTEPLDPDRLAQTEIPYPSLSPVLAAETSFAVEVALPSMDWSSQPATLYFDLFSNDNGIASQGWYSQVTVIPEPSVVGLLAVGLGALATRGRRCASGPPTRPSLDLGQSVGPSGNEAPRLRRTS